MSKPAEARRPPRYLWLADRTWPLLRRLASAHAFLYRRTGGRYGGSFPVLGVKTLLLDHVGAKSGKLRTTPLFYAEDGDDIVLVASKGGYPKNPAWFYNLQANPETAVQIGPERRPVRARVVATPAERERLWPKAVKIYRGYVDYDLHAERELPLIVLEPR